MTYCGERTLVKAKLDHIEATTLKCRSWTCPDCEPQRKRQLLAQALRGKPNTFITLTVKRSRYADPSMAAQALAQAWRLIAKRALRERDRDRTKSPYPCGANDGEEWDLNGKASWPNQVRFKGKALQYLVVIEAHKSGWPHLHILARSEWIDHKWLAAQTKELLDAHIIDIQRINRRSQVSGYCAKYTGKCAHKFGTTKRYWQSGSYQLEKYKPPPSKGEKWTDIEHSNKHLVQIVNGWILAGWEVHQPNWWHAETTTRPPDLWSGGGATAPV